LYYCIGEQIENGVIYLKYCNTEDMVADSDIFTKGSEGSEEKQLRQMAVVKTVN